MMENGTSHYVLAVDGKEIPLSCEDDLLPYLYALMHTEYAEARLLRNDQTMSLLTNRDQKRAFLVFRTEDDPAGHQAVCRDEAGTEEEIGFLLDNGQKDEIACRDTVGLFDGLRALRYFFVRGGMAPFLSWQSDALRTV